MIRDESTTESPIEALYRDIISNINKDKSALDHNITVSEFESLSGSTCYQRKTTLNELAEEIKNTSAKRKDRLPLIKLAAFGGKRSESGSLRHNSNMLGISGVELDYDGEEISPREARSRLRKAGIAALVYTSPSHTPEAPRWRILAPCSRNLPTSARKKLVARINGLFDGAIDPASFTDSQSFYMGSVRGSSPVETYLIDGDYIDRADHLDRCAIGPRERETERTKNPANDNFDLPDLDDAARYLNATSRHLVDDRVFYLTAIFAFADAFGDEARDVVEDWAKQSEKYRRRDFARDWESAFRPYDGERAGLASIIDAARGDWAMTLAEARAAFAEDEDDEPIEPEAPLFRSAARWAGQSAPPREWHVKDMIPAEAVTLLYGDGGTGKSLVGLQLAMATAVGGNWIGQKIRKPGRALFMSAEDSEDELWRRLEDIANSDCREMADLEDLYVESFVDRDPLLSTVDVRARRVRPTELYRRLEREIARLKPTLVVLDTLANLHAGNENDKTEAMQFVNLLKRLASRHGCSIVMLAHPSMNGMSSGSGTAGSVAWSNGVRSRLYLTRIKNEAGGEDDEDARVLRVMKANYAAGGEGIPLRWRDGVFAVDDGEETEQREERVERRFLTLLDEMTRQGRHVSSVMCSTYAPSLFAKHPDSGGFSTHEFAGAMERLLTGERIQLALHGKGASKRQHIERSDS